MDNDHLHGLLKDLIAASKTLTEAAAKFGENSLRTQEADNAYMAANAAFQKENYWHKYCEAEGPWQPECRMYDC